MPTPRFLASTLVTSRWSSLITPAVGMGETGHGAQQRGLAAARGADQHADLAFIDVEIDVLEHGGRVESFGELPDLDITHASFLRDVTHTTMAVATKMTTK